MWIPDGLSSSPAHCSSPSRILDPSLTSSAGRPVCMSPAHRLNIKKKIATELNNPTQHKK